MSSAEFCFRYIEPITDDIIRDVIRDTQYSHYDKEWKLEMEMLGYARRWIVAGQDLPSSIRKKIIDWVRMNECPAYRKAFDVLASALEKNDRGIFITKEMDI